MNFNSQLKSYDNPPHWQEIQEQFQLANETQFFLIYDENLERNKTLELWIAKFPLKYKVRAGESLKDIEQLPQHLKNMSLMLDSLAPRQLCILSLGGGTVGDFTGFVASIYKRGVEYIQIPTTWLSAMDSAHGGKTALNVSGVKNQVGSFYPARGVVIVKSFLESVDPDQQLAAMGELIKMGLINNPQIIEELAKSQENHQSLLWKLLPQAISAKMSIVLEDPFEKKEIRQKLNLGHTLGHVFEAKYGWPHGFAVAQGLYFSLNWSLQRGVLSPEDYESLISVLNKYFKEGFDIQGVKVNPIAKQEFLKYLTGDKKRVSSSEIHFVFVQSAGRVFIEKVSINDICEEAQRQNKVSS